MAIEVMTWAYSTGRPLVERFVLVTLADGAGFDGGCFVDVPDLRAQTGGTVDEIQRALDNLKRDGLLMEGNANLADVLKSKPGLCTLNLNWRPILARGAHRE
jgi:hypothetical protein